MTGTVRGRIARLISYYDHPEVGGDGGPDDRIDLGRVTETIKNHVPEHRDGVWTRCGCGLWCGFDQWASHVAAEIAAL